MNGEKVESSSNHPQGLVDVSQPNSISKALWNNGALATDPVTATLVVSYWSTDNLGVKKEAFRGELEFSYWWANGGGLFYCYSHQYRITRLNGWEGGNKANLHCSFDSLQWWGSDSPDDLRQDGVWHSYARGGWVGANGRARVFARFTFDKAGPDPTEQNELWVNYS